MNQTDPLCSIEGNRFRRKADILVVQPAECRVTDTVPYAGTEGVIVCCLLRATAHFRGSVIDESGSVVE